MPVASLAASAGNEQAQSSSGLTDMASSVRRFLGGEASSIKNWLREILDMPSGRPTPKVTMDLPPIVVKEPLKAPLRPVQPQQPVVVNQAPPVEPKEVVGDKLPETPKVEQITAPQIAAAKPVVVEKTVIKKDPPGKQTRHFEPGNPKPPPPEAAVAAPPKVEKPATPPAPVRHVEAAAQPPQKHISEPPPASGLALGKYLVLGTDYQGDGSNCVKKQNGYVFFCAQDIVWPQDIRKFFDSGASLSLGVQGVVRYDGKKLTHAHALFTAAGLEQVVSYLQMRFGPPLETLQRIVTPFEGRPMNNPTSIWRRDVMVGGQKLAVTLEVRGFDDTRGGFPDMEHGMVRLYGANSLPIFPQVSAIEMMLVKYALN